MTYAFSHTPGEPISHRGDDPAEWLKPMCESWASQWRRVYGSKDDGWPAISLLGRQTEPEENLGQCTALKQGFQEVFTGEALIICRCLVGAPWPVREIIAAHYLVQRTKYPVRAERLGIQLRQYWIRLREGHHDLAGAFRVLRETTPES